MRGTTRGGLKEVEESIKQKALKDAVIVVDFRISETYYLHRWQTCLGFLLVLLLLLLLLLLQHLLLNSLESMVVNLAKKESIVAVNIKL